MTTVFNTETTTIIIKKWMHFHLIFGCISIIKEIHTQMYVQFYLIFT